MFPPREMIELLWSIPDSKIHGANMGPIWGRQDPGGPHVGPMNFAIWDQQNSRQFAKDIFQWMKVFWFQNKIPLKYAPLVGA